MKTRITELLGIEYPVVQGAMARIADGGLAGAVSEAGGLGIIACGGARPEWIREQVARARALTSKPIGINVMLMDPRASEVAELVCELGVEVVTTGAGSPANYMKMWKEAGVKVVPVVASSALAARMERLGADAVVAEGTEAGGHIGELTTMALVPSVAAAVSIPVIAAGGIVDGRGMLAAFALGAEGVQCGTRFLTVEECGVHEAWKEKVLKAKDSDTIVTGRGTGHPVRGLKNKFARECRKIEMAATSGEELEGMYAGSLARAVAGDVENGSVMAGQVVLGADVLRNLPMHDASGNVEEPKASPLPDDPRFAHLTDREHDIVELVAEELDNREIAAKLFLSEGTVRNRISGILAKTHISNRTKLAIEWLTSHDRHIHDHHIEVR